MAKKMRKFGSGGDIVVTGQRTPTPAMINTGFQLSRGTSGGGGGSFGSPGGAGGAGSLTAPSQRLTPITPPASSATARPAITPAVVTQPQSSLGNLVGTPTPTGYGATGTIRFAKGGKAKPKKMAKGGSTASKRGDGCATKGKTKGRFV